MEPTPDLLLVSGRLEHEVTGHHDIFQQPVKMDTTHRTIRQATAELQRLAFTHQMMTTLHPGVHSVTALDRLILKQTYDLNTALAELEQHRSFLRKDFNARARPLIRRLNILDLPDELLIKIFGLVKGGWKTSLIEVSCELWPSDIASVKNTRLTCRRFCNTSSHLLLRYLVVEMNPASLAHLDKVSRHPPSQKAFEACVSTPAFTAPQWPTMSGCLLRRAARGSPTT